MGPGAGVHGGVIIAEGEPATVMAEPASLTGQYLSGIRAIPVPARRRKPKNLRWLELTGCRANNLRDVDARFPLGCFVGVTGVSGSGKSSLVVDTLYPVLAKRLMGARAVAGEHAGLAGLEHVDKVVDIDQSPIGRTPRSNPATYTGAFTPDPRLVRRPARGQGARLRAGPVQLQRQGRALRGLPGRRADQDRDALPAGRVRHLRRLRRQAVQPRDAGGHLPRQVDRRRARHDRGPGGRLLRIGPAGQEQAGGPAAGGAGLHPHRPAGDHALGRRGAAGQARQGAQPACHRPDRLHPGRAHHRPAFRGRAGSCSRCCTPWSTPATR